MYTSVYVFLSNVHPTILGIQTCGMPWPMNDS